MTITKDPSTIYLLFWNMKDWKFFFIKENRQKAFVLWGSWKGQPRKVN